MVSTNQFFIETPSLERLPRKADKFFLPMRLLTIPHQMPTRYLINLIIIIVIIIIIIIIIIIAIDNT